ncbi:MAG: hypothetical protein WAN65_01020 [Candidatus Sulfotelmatobacter sp.]
MNNASPVFLGIEKAAIEFALSIGAPAEQLPIITKAFAEFVGDSGDAFAALYGAIRMQGSNRPRTTEEVIIKAREFYAKRTGGSIGEKGELSIKVEAKVFWPEGKAPKKGVRKPKP